MRTWFGSGIALLVTVVMALGTSDKAHASGARTLSATGTDGVIDITLSGAAGNWWFRIASGTCTAVTNSATVSNIRGYAPGDYEIRAFSDNLCATEIAQTTVTVSEPYSSAVLTATVANDKISLTLANGPNDWWFRINSGTCTAVNGDTVSNISGYAPDVYSVRAFTDAECYTRFAATTVSLPPPTYPLATLTATVSPANWSVDLTLADGPNEWWFRVGGGTCTAVTGTSVNNIQGYRSNGYHVVAYSDSTCGDFLAQTTFIIGTATLSATVQSDDSVNLALSGGPDKWWFIIGGDFGAGTCTTAGGTGVNGISGYGPGAYDVEAYLKEDCSHRIARATFTIDLPPGQTYELMATLRGGKVMLRTSPGQNAWYYKVDAGAGVNAANVSCTFSGALVADVWGLSSGTYTAYSYTDGQCSTTQASTTFDVP